MRRAILLLLSAFPVIAAHARFTSTHFEMLAPKSPGANAILGDLELAHAFFSQSAQLQTPHARLPLIFVPATPAQFQRMKPTGFVAGFYSPLPGRDAIVLESLEFRRAALHEYTHLAIQYSGEHLPRWLNEGLAEYYSTLRPSAGKVEFGHALPDRVVRLRSARWLGISELLAHGQQTRADRTPGREDMFYAQSWLLVHMLISAERYRTKWPEFRKTIATAGDEKEAFQSIYHRSTTQLLEDLHAYFEKGEFTNQSMAMKTVDAQITISAANDFDIEATTAALEGLSGAQPAARAAYRKLQRAGDEGCKWQRELGDLAEASNLFDNALDHRQRDFECRKDAASRCDLARSLGQLPSPPAGPMADAILQLKSTGGCGYAAFLLARHAVNGNKLDDALALLELTRSLPSAQAELADQLREAVQFQVSRKQVIPASATPSNADVEVIRPEDPPQLSRAEGILERVDCNSRPTKVFIRTTLALFTFYVEDRTKFPTMVCGLQKHAVSISFEQGDLKPIGRVGVIRSFTLR